MVLESIVHPYSLTVPADALILAWTPAQRPWDGQERIDFLAGGRYVDKTGVRDGTLLVFGASAPNGLESFFTLDASNGSRYHGCSKPTGRRDVTIVGVKAIAFTQACSADQSHAAVAMVKDSFGLGVVIDTARGNESVALDHLLELLKALAWKQG